MVSKQFRKLGYLFCFFTLLIAGLLAASSGEAAGTDTWHWRNPLPAGNFLTNVTFGNGLFVAVGVDGSIETSSNGLSWTDPPFTTNTLNGVVYADGLFVAVGDNGTILTSIDGSSWVPRSSGTSTSLLSLAYGNSTFVAGGKAGVVLFSADAISWAVKFTGVGTDFDWIAFGAGEFLLPMVRPPISSSFSPSDWAQYATTATLLVSSDGSNWTTNHLPMPLGFNGVNVHTFVYAQGHFFGFVDLNQNNNKYITSVTSIDGINWTNSGTGSGSVYFATFTANGVIFATAFSFPNSETILTTNAGQNFGPVSTQGPSPYFNVAYGAGRYVTVGNSGQIAISTNAVNWTAVSTGTTNQVYAVASSSSGVNVVAGDSTFPLQLSTNGGPFAPAQGNPQLAGVPMYGIACDGSNFVAVGGSGSLQRSTNGSIWTRRISNASADLNGIYFANGLWVGVGRFGTIITSSNSLVWALRWSATAQTLLNVAWGNGLYVAVGVGATIVTSSDGIDWEPQYVDLDPASTLYGVAYGNGRFVAVGSGGGIATSTDGINWATPSTGSTMDIRSIAFGGGQFVAFGTPQPIPNQPGAAFIFRSSDGISWNTIRSPADWGINGLTFANGTFWAAGRNATVLQSDVVSAQPTFAGAIIPGTGMFSLSANNVGGINFTIQARTNPISGIWTNIWSVTNSPLLVNWTDSNSTQFSRRYYRIISP